MCVGCYSKLHKSMDSKEANKETKRVICYCDDCDKKPGRMNLRKFLKRYREYFLGSREKYAPPYDHIVQIGDPVLRYKAKPVDLNELPTEEFGKLLIRMKKVLLRYSCEGLSAPQIGVDKRMFMVHLTNKMISHYKHKNILKIEPIPLQVWINPELKVLDYGTETFPEGCGSFQGFVADVPRYRRVLLKGLNEVGEKKSWEAVGWSARLIQHEMDHLNGKLYIDTMLPKSLECCSWSEINKTKGKVYITFVPVKWWTNLLHPPVK